MGRPAARIRRSPQLAWAITGPLALLAVIATATASVGHSPKLSSPWLSLLYLGLFCAAEATTLNIEVRRHGIEMSVTELPLLLALFYLSPLTTVIVRAVACVLVQSSRRAVPVKLAFNMANVAAATAVATLIVTSLGSPHDATPHTWIVLTVAVLVSTFLTIVAVTGVITLVQGPMTPQTLVRAVVPGMVVGAINTAIGLVLLLVIHASAWAVVLIAGLAVAMGFVYRTYAQFRRQHKSLSEIYDLTRAMAESPYDGTLGDVLLHRVRSLLNAEYATLWMPAQGRYPESQLTARADVRGLLDTAVIPLLLRSQAVETGKTMMAGPKVGTDEARTALRKADIKDAIVVPLRSGSAVIGTLEVIGRMHQSSVFTLDDCRLLETIAAHASVAVENSRLVDRLRFDAYHDSLTGLPNRRRTLAALEEAIKVKTPDDVVAIMLFDVDGLREVNNSLGHGAGDKVLVEFAARLRDLCPAAALVTRVGGDDFAVDSGSPTPTPRSRSPPICASRCGIRWRSERSASTSTPRWASPFTRRTVPKPRCCFSEPTLPRIPPNPVRRRSRCSIRAWSRDRSGGWAWPAICAGRSTTRPLRSTSSRRSRCPAARSWASNAWLAGTTRSMER